MALRKSKAHKTCAVCGGAYQVHAYRAASSRFCGKECWSHRAGTLACPECGQEFRRVMGGQVYCGASCRAAARAKKTGPLANAYKDGKSLERQRGRDSLALREWRNAVYARDGYRCVRCGATGQKLHAHHIRPYAEYPEGRFDVENGVALCIPCHGEEHDRDFGNRRPRHCPTCGKQTAGRGMDGLCMSCAVTAWHARQDATGKTATLESTGEPFGMDER